MFNFYDFEVFEKDWLVVIANAETGQTEKIINDVNRLGEYFIKHQKEIWVGYNNRRYDQFIMKAILCGFNPKEVNDWIIKSHRSGWSYNPVFASKEINFYNYDVFIKDTSLKTLEGRLGKAIVETSIPFDIGRKLTKSELDEVAKYCEYDVENTIEIFYQTMPNFTMQWDLIKLFKMPADYISKTSEQLVSNILRCKRQDRYDEWHISIVPVLDIKKYDDVVEWYKSPLNYNYGCSLTRSIAGVDHCFRWGGLHGGLKQIHYKGVMLHIDVTSFYPSIMINYGFLSRNAKAKSLYKQIYDKRIELKKQGKKKEQLPYKFILNKTYGLCKDKYSNCYDPLMANNVCVNGQLLLLDLIEHIEPYCELIQSNTDGIIIKIDEKDYDRIDDICYEWEKRTGLNLEFDNIVEIWQKDVNNYVYIQDDEKIVRKGEYVKELTALDNDLYVVNKAIVDYLTKGISPEVTVRSTDCLKDFQRTVHISSDYDYMIHNGKVITDRTCRIFASRNVDDSTIYKIKNGRKEKIDTAPQHLYIDNDNINDKVVPNLLDREWYIELAKKRITDFGLTDFVDKGLFDV